MAWIMAHWQQLLLALLGIDAALLPLFPESGILLKIKDVLSSIAPK